MLIEMPILLLAAMSIVEPAKWIIIVLVVAAILTLIARMCEVPAEIIKMGWLVVAAVVAIVTIKFVAGL